MTVYDAMLAHAYFEFDATVAETELVQRERLRGAGWSQEKIDLAIERCRPSLAEQRRTIPSMVAVAMMQGGIQVERGIPA